MRVSKPISLAALVLCCMCSVSQGAIRFVASAVALRCSPAFCTATTSGIDTTGATLLVVAVQQYAMSTTGGYAVVVSDSVGGSSNTWTVLTNYASNGSENTTLFYAVPTHTGSGHTFSVYGYYASLVVGSWSGTLAASPLDGQVGSGSTGAVVSFQPGALLPSEDGGLVVVAAVANAGTDTAIAVDGPFADNLFAEDESGQTLAMSYEIQTTATSRNPTWSGPGNYVYAAISAVFKPAAGGGGPAPRRRVVIVQ
jgi:hypothetical protein